MVLSFCFCLLLSPRNVSTILRNSSLSATTQTVHRVVIITEYLWNHRVKNEKRQVMRAAGVGIRDAWSVVLLSLHNIIEANKVECEYGVLFCPPAVVSSILLFVGDLGLGTNE